MAIDSGLWFSMIRSGDYVEVKIPALAIDEVLLVQELWRIAYDIRHFGRHLPVDFTDAVFSRLHLIQHEWHAYRRDLVKRERRFALVGGLAITATQIVTVLLLGYLLFLWGMA